MATTDKRCSLPTGQVQESIDQTIKAADPTRAKSLHRLQRVRTVKLKTQERDRVRLAEKLGADSPRVLALQTKIETNQEISRNLKLEAVRAQTETPEVPENGWMVYGRVLNNQRTPVPGLKTGLYDASGCPIPTCGKEITDKTGYFKLNITSVPGDTTGGDQQTPPKVGFVHVMDKNDVTIHEDKTPLNIKAGKSQYLEIVLKDDGGISDETPTTRYLGNSNTKELHDLNNRKAACRIESIKSDHRFNFKTQQEALALGYDFCAYCFGKDKSKR